MATATTKNPYLLYGEEPKDWKSYGNVKSWDQHKKDTQAQNESWWKVHTADGNYPHQMETPLGVEGSDFPLGQGNRYGPFIYCPFPLEGIVRWGFRRADGFAAFRLDVENDTLPKGGAAKSSAMVTRKPKVAAKAPEPVATGAAPDLTDAAHAEPPAADLDLSGDLDLSVDDGDPFADLDMGSEPTASAVEDDPFADLDMGTPEAESAPAEPPQAAVTQIEGDDDETDEWGEPINKPPADEFDL